MIGDTTSRQFLVSAGARPPLRHLASLVVDGTLNGTHDLTGEGVHILLPRGVPGPRLCSGLF